MLGIRRFICCGMGHRKIFSINFKEICKPDGRRREMLAEAMNLTLVE